MGTGQEFRQLQTEEEAVSSRKKKRILGEKLWGESCVCCEPESVEVWAQSKVLDGSDRLAELPKLHKPHHTYALANLRPFDGNAFRPRPELRYNNTCLSHAFR